MCEIQSAKAEWRSTAGRTGGRRERQEYSHGADDDVVAMGGVPGVRTPARTAAGVRLVSFIAGVRGDAEAPPVDAEPTLVRSVSGAAASVPGVSGSPPAASAGLR